MPSHDRMHSSKHQSNHKSLPQDHSSHQQRKPSEVQTMMEWVTDGSTVAMSPPATNLAFLVKSILIEKIVQQAMSTPQLCQPSIPLGSSCAMHARTPLHLHSPLQLPPTTGLIRHCLVHGHVKVFFIFGALLTAEITKNEKCVDSDQSPENKCLLVVICFFCKASRMKNCIDCLC